MANSFLVKLFSRIKPLVQVLYTLSESLSWMFFSLAVSGKCSFLRVSQHLCFLQSFYLVFSIDHWALRGGLWYICPFYIWTLLNLSFSVCSVVGLCSLLPSTRRKFSAEHWTILILNAKKKCKNNFDRINAPCGFFNLIYYLKWAYMER